MKRYRVTLRPEAEADLNALFDFIVEQAGPDIAGGYVERIYAACSALATFPERGTLRGNMNPPLRTIGFERRATIVFRVMGTNVQILRVLHGGQDIEQVLRDAAND